MGSEAGLTPHRAQWLLLASWVTVWATPSAHALTGWITWSAVTDTLDL